MRNGLVVMAALLGLSLLGCGGQPVDEEATPQVSDARTVSQFSTCTATCTGSASVSCTGTVCSATNGSGVTCDGVFTACAAQPTCSGKPLCSAYVSKSCSPPRSFKPCCLSNGNSDQLYCQPLSGSVTRGIWMYY